ncbi:hypothetical protein HDU92_001037 [Lobulomyces angularis]|nr:hypothetical protein HDU92_001037 [Lobulomyces angularis]
MLLQLTKSYSTKLQHFIKLNVKLNSSTSATSQNSKNIHGDLSQNLTPSEIATFSAFAHRSGLKFKNTSTLISALTHSSFKNDNSINHQRLQYLGHNTLKLFATEFVYFKYPNMPSEVVDSVTKGYIGRKALASVGEQFGIQNVMRWKIDNNDPTHVNAKPYVISKVTEALIGALYQEEGAQAARRFIHSHFLNRSVDVRDHLLYLTRDPRLLLLKVTTKLGKRRPVARLLKESGRESNYSAYVVGLFIEAEKISEGYGESIHKAEIKATRAALEMHYLETLKEIELPSNLITENTTFFDADDIKEVGDN